MTIVAVIVAVALGVAALLTVGRMVRGPSLLDRVVAAEVLIAVILGGLGAEAAVNRHATTLPVLVVLSLLGFVGSVSIVRFVAARSAPAGRQVERRQGERR
ncbi:monovalent cation/H+ antiporter complex subunit F [Solwaraspora sp. WMMB335]|uniref:monovalent cation/H+ antiporter complex subunit F n=1 Tax=Solwaraspora sp. WMMB335 TaxID=3404118 RepID=UPI003B930018